MFAHNGLIGLAILATFLHAPAQQKLQEQSTEHDRLQPQQNDTPVRLQASQTKSLLQPRQFAAVAHDSVDSQFLLFGGTYGSQRFDDTWLLTSSGWTVQNPKAHPSARISSAAAYDSQHDQFLLFGGRVQQAKPAMCSPGAAPARLKTEFFCSDTWLFTGGNWVEKFPAVSPAAREGHAMAFDAARNQVVLFGGTAGSSSTPLSDTWLWNGTKWKQAIPVHSPPARLWHSMAYDPIHKQVVLFGGDGGKQFLNDTWIWNGKDWQMAAPQTKGPDLRTNAGLDYDPTTGKMVLFSGSVWTSQRNGLMASDSWSWDGTQWQNIASSKFETISNFSKLTLAELKSAILASGTPSVLWLPLK